jgi:transketolase
MNSSPLQKVLEDGSVERLAIDTIRTLTMDAVQQANSGHPGTPMALAPAAYTLWRDHLRYDPDTPDWPNRDRFVLSPCLDAALRAAAPRRSQRDRRRR